MNKKALVLLTLVAVGNGAFAIDLLSPFCQSRIGICGDSKTNPQALASLALFPTGHGKFLSFDTNSRSPELELGKIFNANHEFLLSQARKLSALSPTEKTSLHQKLRLLQSFDESTEHYFTPAAINSFLIQKAIETTGP